MKDMPAATTFAADAPWQPYSVGSISEARPTVIVIKRPDAAGLPAENTAVPSSPSGIHGLWQTPLGHADPDTHGHLYSAFQGIAHHADPLSDLHGHLYSAFQGAVHHADPLSDLHVWFSAFADPMHDADLLAALSDLQEVVDEASDEGLKPPSDEGLRNAERLLRSMYALRRCRFEVYPAEDGEVAVYAPGGHGRSVLVLCDSDGGVRCLVNLNGQHRRALYDADSAANLPDGFVREALAELDE